MVELERIDSTNLSEGAIVTTLENITEKPNPGYSCDIPEERAFFLKEEFATFNCMESYGDQCCEFRLISQIPWMDHYAWAVFGHHNLNFERDEVSRKVHGRAAFVTQKFAFELVKDADFGYFQMICIPDQVCYDSTFFHKFDLLTFAVYKDRKVSKKIAKPPVITLRPYADQTYVPMLPGQHLQLVVFDEEDIEIVEDGNMEIVPGMGKVFSLGRNDKQEKLKSAVYRCCSMPETIEPIFVSKKRETRTVLLTPMKKESRGVFATVLKPVKEGLIHTEGVDGVHVICPDKEKWAWDDKCVDMHETDDGVDIVLLKPTNSLYLHLDGNVWWVYENPAMVVGKL